MKPRPLQAAFFMSVTLVAVKSDSRSEGHDTERRSGFIYFIRPQIRPELASYLLTVKCN